MIEEGQTRQRWSELSPFATPPTAPSLPEREAEGSVRFLLVSGELDDRGWGVVGAFWLSTDEERGGFIISPDALWHGSEMVRSFRGALDRGWTEARIYRYWEAQAGSVGTYMIDPESRARNLFELTRRVGAL